MQPTHQTGLSPELTDISMRCSEVLTTVVSSMQNVSILYRDKAGKTLTIVAPCDDEIIAQLPEGGTFFTGII